MESILFNFKRREFLLYLISIFQEELLVVNIELEVIIPIVKMGINYISFKFLIRIWFFPLSEALKTTSMFILSTMPV